MSKSCYRWWGYVRAVIRDYPVLCRAAGKHTLTVTEQRERRAVRRALDTVWDGKDGGVYYDFISLIYWKAERMTLDKAAAACYISERTAQRWHSTFIRLVAYHMGLLG